VGDCRERRQLKKTFAPLPYPPSTRLPALHVGGSAAGVSDRGDGVGVDRNGGLGEALADGGKINIPLPAFWAEGFGMCIDRFGTP
jgi:hypothetical protein